MAGKRKVEYNFFCEACVKGFTFQSKYSGHIESGSHKMFVENLNIEARDSEEVQPEGFESPEVLPYFNESIDKVTYEVESTHITADTCLYRMYMSYQVAVVKKVKSTQSPPSHQIQRLMKMNLTWVSKYC